MANTRVSRGFKDISLSFDMHPITKDILVLKNEDAIRKSIRNLVQTIPSERFFNPVIGAEVRTSLFEFIDFGTASLLQQQILISITNNEPRVDKTDVQVVPKPDLNSYEITIKYTIIGDEFPPQSFTYILEATR
jgi:phage baseplate assembly protein W